MTYTLQKMIKDCRTALKTDTESVGRHTVRKLVEKACMDNDFVSTYLGPDNKKPREILYEDEDFGFCILAHVSKPETGLPHDHGPTWAIYGIAEGITEMTDWFCKERPKGRLPGKVHRVKSYSLPRGTAHLYNEGDLHSSKREKEVRMIRVEGINLLKVRRQKFHEAD